MVEHGSADYGRGRCGGDENESGVFWLFIIGILLIWVFTTRVVVQRRHELTSFWFASLCFTAAVCLFALSTCFYLNPRVEPRKFRFQVKALIVSGLVNLCVAQAYISVTLPSPWFKAFNRVAGIMWRWLRSFCWPKTRRWVAGLLEAGFLFDFERRVFITCLSRCVARMRWRMPSLYVLVCFASGWQHTFDGSASGIRW